MKIYIDNYKPISVLDKLSLLDSYFIKKNNIIEIYSISGIYNITNTKIYQMIPYSDNKSIIITNYYKNNSLIIDNSVFIQEETHHIPNNHIHLNLTSFIYAINSKSKLYLIIEGYDKENNSITNNNDRYNNFIPSNFYFEIIDKKDANEKFDINDPFIKNDIIEFLLLLI